MTFVEFIPDLDLHYGKVLKWSNSETWNIIDTYQ